MSIPNNSRNSQNDDYSFTGWNSMKTLTNKDRVEKKSNPAVMYQTRPHVNVMFFRHLLKKELDLLGE